MLRPKLAQGTHDSRSTDSHYWQRRRSDGDEEEARDQARGQEERTPRAGDQEALRREEGHGQAWREEGREALGREAPRAGGEALGRQEGRRTQEQHTQEQRTQEQRTQERREEGRRQAQHGEEVEWGRWGRRPEACGESRRAREACRVGCARAGAERGRLRLRGGEGDGREH